MEKPLQTIADSTPVQIGITLITYALYATILGISLFPSVSFLLWSYRSIFGEAIRLDPAKLLLYSLCLGGGVFIYFVCGLVVMGLSIRLMHTGIGPGRYPMASPTVLRWLIYSGIYTLAYVTILPLVPVSYFSNLFFKIIGCRFGKRVYLNTYVLNDAYLIEIGDDVTIGGQTNISPHYWENGHLILSRVKIGSGTLIGAKSYISPGVTIGKNCVIGLNTFIRRGKNIPDGSVITCLAGLPMRDMARIEKGLPRNRRPGA